MSVIRLFSVLFIAMALVYPAQAADQKEMVVILHGIARTSSSMRPVELALQKEGYDTLNITYPSTDKDLDGLASYLREKTPDKRVLAECWKGSYRYTFHGWVGNAAFILIHTKIKFQKEN